MRFLLPILLLAACGSTGQRRVSYDLLAEGAAPGPFAAGAWTVTLDVAQLGIGPIYFCATEAASMDLCPVAVNEFANAAAFDLRDPSPRSIGTVEGVTGEIRSATYDFAFTWFTTQRTPQAAPAAPNGHSAHFEGTATRGAQTIRFVSDVDVLPSYAGTLAVQGRRVSATITTDAPRALHLRVDPSAWWQDVDFDELAAIGGDPVIVPSDSRATGTLITRMTTGSHPSFEWSNP